MSIKKKIKFFFKKVHPPFFLILICLIFIFHLKEILANLSIRIIALSVFLLYLWIIHLKKMKDNGIFRLIEGKIQHHKDLIFYLIFSLIFIIIIILPLYFLDSTALKEIRIRDFLAKNLGQLWLNVDFSLFLFLIGCIFIKFSIVNDDKRKKDKEKIIGQSILTFSGAILLAALAQMYVWSGNMYQTDLALHKDFTQEIESIYSQLKILNSSIVEEGEIISNCSKLQEVKINNTILFNITWNTIFEESNFTNLIENLNNDIRDCREDDISKGIDSLIREIENKSQIYYSWERMKLRVNRHGIFHRDD